MEEEFFVAFWIAIALGLWVLKLKWSNRKLRRALAANIQPAPVAAPSPVTALPEPKAPARDHEMERLRERVAVLERITCEKESTLSREIDSLRTR